MKNKLSSIHLVLKYGLQPYYILDDINNLQQQFQQRAWKLKKKSRQIFLFF